MNQRSVANTAAYYQQAGQQFQRGPLVKPIDSCWRGYYETGRGLNFNSPGLPTVAFEAQAEVAKQPCWLVMAHAVFPAIAQDRYLLLYDLNPGDPAQLALVVPGAAARFTFGPVTGNGGGTIVYEASGELVPVPFQGAPQNGPDKPWAYGMPFNFGIIAVPSATPRIWTQLVNPVSLALTCRVQT